MSEAATALAALRAAGLAFRQAGGKLLASPASAITAAHRDLIARHRDALVALLQDEEATAATVAAFQPTDGSGHRGGLSEPRQLVGVVAALPREAGTWVGWCRVSPGRWQPVVTAASYASAWRLLQQHRPAAVTCDKWVGKEGVKP